MLMALICAAGLQLPAMAQDENAAKQFVAALYQRYNDHKTTANYDWDKLDGKPIYHSTLKRLMDEDAKANGPDQVGVLDSDPICGCQDWEGMYQLKVDVIDTQPDRVTLAAQFALTKPKAGEKPDMRTVELTLVSEEGAWRVWDVVDRSDQEAPFVLRTALEQDIRSLAAQKPQ